MANITDIQKSILTEDFFAVVKDFLSTDSDEVANLWIEENKLRLRSWVLHSRLGVAVYDPSVISSFLENSTDPSSVKIYEAYKKADEMFPLVANNEAKQVVRKRIFDELGNYDVYEMVADLSKRICMLERLLVRVSKHLKDNNLLSEYVVQAYGPMIEGYLAGLAADVIRDRTDLEDSAAVFNKLQFRTAKIADIVKQELFPNL